MGAPQIQNRLRLLFAFDKAHLRPFHETKDIYRVCKETWTRGSGQDFGSSFSDLLCEVVGIICTSAPADAVLASCSIATCAAGG